MNRHTLSLCHNQLCPLFGHVGYLKFVGEWKPKQIKNPAYKGKWVHPEIDNPEYNEDKEIYAFEDFGRIGLDLWQVKIPV